MLSLQDQKLKNRNMLPILNALKNSIFPWNTIKKKKISGIYQKWKWEKRELKKIWNRKLVSTFSTYSHIPLLIIYVFILIKRKFAIYLLDYRWALFLVEIMPTPSFHFWLILLSSTGSNDLFESLCLRHLI